MQVATGTFRAEARPREELQYLTVRGDPDVMAKPDSIQDPICQDAPLICAPSDPLAIPFISPEPVLSYLVCCALQVDSSHEVEYQDSSGPQHPSKFLQLAQVLGFRGKVAPARERAKNAICAGIPKGEGAEVQAHQGRGMFLTVTDQVQRAEIAAYHPEPLGLQGRLQSAPATGKIEHE